LPYVAHGDKNAKSDGDEKATDTYAWHGSADREKGRYISSGIVMWICSGYLAPEYARPIVRNVGVLVTGRKKKGL